MACAVLFAASLYAGQPVEERVAQSAAAAQSHASAGGSRGVVTQPGTKAAGRATPMAATAPAADSAGPFTLLSSLTTPSVPVSIALNGTLAYVCTPNEIVTVDISDAKNPRTLAVNTTPLINNSGDISCSVQRGVLAVFADQVNTGLGNTPGFVAFSLTNPQNPQVIKETLIHKRFFQSPVYIGNYAFVPTGAVTYYGFLWLGQFGDLLSVDLSDFTAPVLLDTLADPIVHQEYGGEHAYWGASQAADRLVYVGSTTATGGDNDGVGRLLTVDVTNPAAMTTVSELTVPGTIYLAAPLIQGTVGVSLGNTGGYVGGSPPTCCDGNIVVVTFDLSNRRNPAIRAVTITEFKTGEGGGAARIGNNQFLVAGVHDKTGAEVLLLIDTTNPYAPAFKTYPLASPFHSMAASGNFLYVAADSGFLIYSIPGGSAPESSCPAAIDAALVLDLTGSFSGDLLAEVKTGAKQFLDRLVFSTDRVAVVQAGRTATLVRPLSADKVAAAAAIDSMPPGADSYIGAAILAAQNELLGPGKNPDAGRAIVLFSDGKDAAAPTASSTAQAAAAAKAAGIRIITIGYGASASKLTALASAPGDAYTTSAQTDLKLVTVLDATTAIGILKIDPQATPGPRTCKIATGTQAMEMPNAFSVLPVSVAAPTNIITLQSATPATGSGGTSVSVTLSRLPDDTSASGVRVTLTPENPGKSTIAVVASTVQTTASGSIVGFQIPQTLRVTAPTSYQIGISGRSRTGVVFTGVNQLPLTVMPSAGIAGVAPNGASRNSTTKVRIFVQGISLLNTTVSASFGAGTRVAFGDSGGFGPIAVETENTATATVVVAVDAVVGPRTVALNVGGTLYTLDKAFSVIAEFGPPKEVKLISVTPTEGTTFTLTVQGLPPGQIRTTDVKVTLTSATEWFIGTMQTNPTSLQSSNGTGQIVFSVSEGGGSWLSGVTFDVSISGVTANYVPFASSNTLPVKIAPGPRVWQVGDLFVGTTVTVTLKGELTHFAQGQTMARYGQGISVGGAAAGDWGPVTVTGPTDASVELQILADAEVFGRTFEVKTGSEIVSSWVEVIGPKIDYVSPNSSLRGRTLDVTITGSNTHFAPGVSVASFGPDIRVGGGAAGEFGPVTVANGVTATATIEILPTAANQGIEGGGVSHDVTVRTGQEIAVLQGAFEVEPEPDTEPHLYVSSVYVGQTADVGIWLENTTLQPGAQINLGPGIRVGDAAEGDWGPVTAIDSTRGTVTATVSAAAARGPRTVTLRNGTQTLETEIYVQEQGEIVSVTPALSTVLAGSTVQLTVKTRGITLQPDVTQFYITSGAVSVTDFAVTGPDTLTVSLSVPATANDGPAKAVVYSEWGQTDEFPLFTIVNPLPRIFSVSPSWVSAGSTLTFTVKVKGLTLVPGQVVANLGPGTSVAGAAIGAYGPVQVTAPDTMTFTGYVSGNVPSGYRTVQVKVGSQVYEGSFYVSNSQ